jgi:hypothetical protein
MNFDAAMAAHAAWYMKLSKYLSKPDGSLSAFLAESANHCELGMWLNSDGEAYAHMPEFEVLVTSHEEFHRIAGGLIRKANAGQSVPDEIALGATSELALASSKLVRSMITIETKTRDTNMRAA